MSHVVLSAQNIDNKFFIMFECSLYIGDEHWVNFMNWSGPGLCVCKLQLAPGLKQTASAVLDTSVPLTPAMLGCVCGDIMWRVVKRCRKTWVAFTLTFMFVKSGPIGCFPCVVIIYVLCCGCLLTSPLVSDSSLPPLCVLHLVDCRLLPDCLHLFLITLCI